METKTNQNHKYVYALEKTEMNEMVFWGIVIYCEYCGNVAYIKNDSDIQEMQKRAVWPCPRNNIVFMEETRK